MHESVPSVVGGTDPGQSPLRRWASLTCGLRVHAHGIIVHKAGLLPLSSELRNIHLPAKELGFAVSSKFDNLC